MDVSQPYELLVRTDAHELWSRIDDAAARYRDLATSVDDSLPLRASSWCARDVTGHLLTVLRRYTNREVSGSSGLAPTPRGVDELNAAELAALAGMGTDQLLADIAIELKTIREVFGPDAVDLHMTVPFHAGATVDIAAGLANLVGEFLVHGWDVARAAGRAWPIAEVDARLVLNGVVQMLPNYVKRDARGALAIRLNLPDARPWLLDIRDGSGVSRPWRPGDRVDAVLRAPAATMVLAMYGRISLGSATRHGLRVVGGRRPWRSITLPSLIERP